MGQYYYRPVDPGWSALGAGIAGGIEQGVGSFLDERDRTREGKRQDEEDARRRAQEDEQTKRDLLAEDVWLMERGGGRGQAPGALDLDWRGAAGMAMAGPTDRGRDDLFGQRPQLGPEGPSAIRQQLERKGPILTPVGPPGYGYIEEPESRGRRFAGEEARAARGAEEFGQGRIASSLIGMRPDLPPEQAQAAAQLMGTGGIGYEDLFPGPKAPVRGTPEYLTALEEEAKIGAKYRQPREPRDIRPTIAQALEMLQDIYSVYEGGEWAGYAVDPQTLGEYAEKIASGEMSLADLPTRPPPRGEDLVPGEELPEVELPPLYARPPEGRERPQGAEPPPRAEVPMTAEEVREARDFLSRFPEATRAEEARKRGATEAEIRQILGGR